MKKILYILFLILQFASFCFAKNEQEDKTEYLNLNFWSKFQDEILIDNLKTAFQNNLDLKIAAYKVKESEKIVKLALGEELPQIDFEPLIGQTFSSSDEHFGSLVINSYNQSRFLLPLYVSYEIDIWGKNRLKTKSRTQSLKMIKQDEKSTYILLSSAIGADYFNLIKIDKTLAIEKKLLSLNEELLRLIENKEKAGLATKDDVLAIKENVVKIKAKINNYETKKETLENQLSYLLGDKLFKEVKRNDFDSITMPFSAPETLESQIILNRPDVILKSENIIRANYDARIAKRELLPSFTITGTFGFNGYNNLKGIFGSHTGIAEVFVAPRWNIFDGARRFNFMKLKQIELSRAKEEYEKTILASLKEVNDSLAIFKNEERNYDLSLDVYDIQSEKLKLKSNNAKYGLSSKADYITYEIAQNIALEKLINDKVNYIISSIGLYKSTGGVDFSENL